jgi:hypothetical protein
MKRNNVHINQMADFIITCQPYVIDLKGLPLKQRVFKINLHTTPLGIPPVKPLWPCLSQELLNKTI